MLLSGAERPAPADPGAVDRFLAYASGQELVLGLHTAKPLRGGRPLAAATLAGPGRAAMALCCPLPEAASVPAAAALLRDAFAALRGVRVAQALLETDQPHQRAAFEAAGFEPLATLVYLEGMPAAGGGGAADSEGLGALEERAWGPAEAGVFAAAVEATYEGTLDCPGLIGRRPIAEVLAGHRAAGGPGAFAPARWRVFLDAAGPVAVLLLARLPHEPTLEVVYVGVALRARGRGLGRLLLRRALAEATRAGAEKVVLAADAANVPALRLYRAEGFRTVQRRLALARFCRLKTG